MNSRQYTPGVSFTTYLLNTGRVDPPTAVLRRASNLTKLADLDPLQYSDEDDNTIPTNVIGVSNTLLDHNPGSVNYVDPACFEDALLIDFSDLGDVTYREAIELVRDPRVLLTRQVQADGDGLVNTPTVVYVLGSASVSPITANRFKNDLLHYPATGEVRRVTLVESTVVTNVWKVTLDRALSATPTAWTLVNFLAAASSSASGGGSGTGPTVVTITVTDDAANPLAGAAVSLTDGVGYAGVTDAEGLVSFGLVDGAYTLAVAKEGYSFTPATVAVPAVTAYTATMTTNVVSPAADPSETTASLTAYDEQNNPASGINFQIALVSGPGVAGRSFPRDYLDLTSNGSGVVAAALLRSSTYRIRRQRSSGKWSDWLEFTTPDASTYSIPETLGLWGA